MRNRTSSFLFRDCPTSFGASVSVTTDWIVADIFSSASGNSANIFWPGIRIGQKLARGDHFDFDIHFFSQGRFHGCSSWRGRALAEIFVPDIIQELFVVIQVRQIDVHFRHIVEETTRFLQNRFQFFETVSYLGGNIAGFSGNSARVNRASHFFVARHFC